MRGSTSAGYGRVLVGCYWCRRMVKDLLLVERFWKLWIGRRCMVAEDKKGWAARSLRRLHWELTCPTSRFFFLFFFRFFRDSNLLRIQIIKANKRSLHVQVLCFGSWKATPLLQLKRYRGYQRILPQLRCSSWAVGTCHSKTF